LIKKSRKWVLLVAAVLVVIVILIAAVAIKTATFTNRQLATPAKVSYPIDVNQSADRLSKAIQFKTVFNTDRSLVDYEKFAKLQQYIEASYPLVHSKLEKKIINSYGLVYIWKGSDQTLKPVLLLAHQDVVPASEEGWKYPPFSGTVADGYIWGRGSLDDKCTLLGMLEGVEYLLKEDFKLVRSLYLAFGFDEEITGMQGAGKIAEYFKSNGLEFEYINDEGEILISGAIPGIAGPVALIGTAEKGYLSLELSADSEGGHSSMPPRQTTVGIVAAAVDKLERNPFPARMSGPTGDMFDYLGPNMRFPYNMIFANMWLLGPVIEDQLASSPATDATVRTTIAPTMFQASQRENVLPARATAVVNFRLMPGDSIESVIQRVKTVINDPRVSAKIYGQGANEASPVSSTTSWAFKTMNKTIRQIFPEALVSPALVNSASDSSRYIGLSPSILRFLPQRFESKELVLLHGLNERISISNYEEMINFYIQLVRNSCG
jgi:carboxypeptidase PM20D1